VLACVEKRGELRWVVGCSLGGERWDGEEEEEEEGEIDGEEERVSAEPVYTGFSNGITDGIFPSVIPLVLATRSCLVVRV
jgi:hypothetical protein